MKKSKYTTFSKETNTLRKLDKARIKLLKEWDLWRQDKNILWMDFKQTEHIGQYDDKYTCILTVIYE